MSIRSRRKSKTNRTNKIKSRRGGQLGWLKKRLGMKKRVKSETELVARDVKRDTKAQKKGIVKILKGGPKVDNSLPDCRTAEITVCPEFIGSNHFDSNSNLIDETVQKLSTIRTAHGEFINKSCNKCIVTDKNSIKKKDGVSQCVDGRGVEILSDIGEHTNKLDPSKKVTVAKHGNKICNVSEESHRKYYNSLLNAKDRQRTEFKGIQKAEKSKSVEATRLKAAQEKLFKIDETQRQTELKKVKRKQDFNSKYHKSNCVCTSSNNKDVVTRKFPLYQKCEKPSIEECLDHKTTSDEGIYEELPVTKDDAEGIYEELPVTKDEPIYENLPVTKDEPIYENLPTGGRIRRRKLKSRKKRKRNSKKRQRKTSRKRKNTQMSGAGWFKDLFKGKKKEDIGMSDPLLQDEPIDLLEEDVSGAPQLPPLPKLPLQESPELQKEPIKENIKEKFAILEKDGVFNVVKLNKDEDGFITRRFSGGSRKKRRINKKKNRKRSRKSK